MALAVQAEFDTFMAHAFFVESGRDSCASQHIDTALLEDSCANSLFAVLPRPRFKDNGMNTVQVEQVRKHQSGWTCADDANLSLKASHLCILRLFAVLSHLIEFIEDRLREMKSGVGCGNTAVDGALQQGFLDLVAGYAVVD